MSTRDVIVVGGGPAGSATAAFLAGAGFDVLLLDRARFPRDKPCGEFLTPGTEPVLRALGAWERVRAAGPAPVRQVVLHGPDGARAAYVPPDGAPAGWAVRRTALDAVLLDHARACGVEVREGVAVWSIERTTCLTLTTSDFRLTTRFLVGADGTHSLVARSLGMVRPIRRLQRVAIVTHWRGVPESDAIEMRSRGGTVCGFGPLGRSEANVTLVVPQEDATRIAGRAQAFAQERIAERFPDLATRLAGVELVDVRTIGCFGHVTRRASADGALLVGDAATFVDPFSGEGVYFALRGAELAGRVAAEALRAGDTSAARLEAYDRARREELIPRYRLCAFVQAVVRTPVLYNRVLASLSASPRLLYRLMGVLGDVRPPSDVLSAGFLWQLAVGSRG